MRRSRPFRPFSILELEGRVVPSQIAPTGVAHATEVRPVSLTAAEIARSNASEVSFGVDTSETLQSGLPVAEQLTTTYNDGSTQTESLLEVPNIANDTVTTYKTIREPDGSVEHQKITTTKRGELDSTTTTTTILPDGTVQRSSSATDVTRVQPPSS